MTQTWFLARNIFQYPFFHEGTRASLHPLFSSSTYLKRFSKARSLIWRPSLESPASRVVRNPCSRMVIVELSIRSCRLVNSNVRFRGNFRIHGVRDFLVGKFVMVKSQYVLFLPWFRSDDPMARLLEVLARVVAEDDLDFFPIVVEILLKKRQDAV